MMEILIPILAVTVIGLICAVGLAVASSFMAVKEDTRFTEIRACLPGANCGACGYTGCDGYAKALLEPGTKTNLCVPGADAVAAQIAALLERTALRARLRVIGQRHITGAHRQHKQRQPDQNRARALFLRLHDIFQPVAQCARRSGQAGRKAPLVACGLQ